jgi:hypothetical protein
MYYAICFLIDVTFIAIGHIKMKRGTARTYKYVMDFAKQLWKQLPMPKYTKYCFLVVLIIATIISSAITAPITLYNIIKATIKGKTPEELRAEKVNTDMEERLRQGEYNTDDSFPFEK